MRAVITAILMVLFAVPAVAQNEDPFAGFEPLMGTWAGDSTDPEQAGNRDVMRFEPIIGGAAVQHTHSINDGIYGGRTIYFWDSALNDGEGGIIYHYFTTAGFHTQGTAWWEEGVLVAEEAVTGHPDIAGVRSYVTFAHPGVRTSSSYLTHEGEWIEGHGFVYEPAPDAEVVFGHSE